MLQPGGYVQEGQEHEVCHRLKGLYGLKQSGRCWRHKYDDSMQNLGFTPLLSEPCLYIRGPSEGRQYVNVFVDN